MIVCGIDPGIKGAIAVIGDGRREVWDMPVGKITVGKSTKDRIAPELLGFMLRNMMPFDVAVIEEVHSTPQMGVTSSFTFGQAHGLVLGAVAALGVRVVRTRPQEWQKAVKATTDPRMRALELYPAFADDLKRKIDEGRGDAILLAHYGLEMEKK